MTLQIDIIERRADGSEERRGPRAFVSIPAPGDQIFVARSTCTDRMRVLAIRHAPFPRPADANTSVGREPKLGLLAELIDSQFDLPASDHGPMRPTAIEPARDIDPKK